MNGLSFNRPRNCRLDRIRAATEPKDLHLSVPGFSYLKPGILL